MQGQKILVIDDDPLMLRLIAELFQQERAEVFTAAGGFAGLRQFYAQQPNLVIIDIMLPDINGWDVCRQMHQFSDTPLIFLSALNAEEEIIRGLDCGAVDYVTKPFEPRMLLARTRAALRQAEAGKPVAAAPQNSTYFDDYLTIDLDRRRVLVQGEPVKLTRTEYRLLTYLFKNKGAALSFEQIVKKVWGHEYNGSVEYVHVHLSNLRKKLEEDTKSPRYLLSEYGVGYRFQPRIIHPHRT